MARFCFGSRSQKSLPRPDVSARCRALTPPGLSIGILPAAFYKVSWSLPPLAFFPLFVCPLGSQSSPKCGRLWWLTPTAGMPTLLVPCLEFPVNLVEWALPLVIPSACESGKCSQPEETEFNRPTAYNLAWSNIQRGEPGTLTSSLASSATFLMFKLCCAWQSPSRVSRLFFHLKASILP